MKTLATLLIASVLLTTQANAFVTLLAAKAAGQKVKKEDKERIYKMFKKAVAAPTPKARQGN